MFSFHITNEPIDIATLRHAVHHRKAGGFVLFEGAVRDHHQGRSVRCLDYQAYVPMAAKIGEQIFNQAKQRWPINSAMGAHRLGHLAIGEIAVWVGIAAPHRVDAFAACAWVMDEIKSSLPVWKREYFLDGSVEWGTGIVLASNEHA